MYIFIDMLNTITIGTKKVGPGEPVFIIAEAGVNHNGDIALARKLVDAAAAAGADAVKFQTFTAETLVTKDAAQCDYQVTNTGKKESQYDMLKRLELSPAAHYELKQYADQRGIIFLSTPFNEADADFLEGLVPAYKIPSGEVTNLPYLSHIAKKQKPMILSTGMSTLAEVQEALAAIYQTGNQNVIVLHSTSNYPPSDASLNLRVIPALQEELKVPIGYSDNGHGTLDGYPLVAPIMAATLGACLIEKHFTLDKSLPGPDQRASLTPAELKEMVTTVHKVEVMLGSLAKQCTPEEESVRQLIRKSIVTRRAIARGAVVQREDLMTKRPGDGIPPKQLDSLIGRKATRDIPADTKLTAADYE